MLTHNYTDTGPQLHFAQNAPTHDTASKRCMALSQTALALHLFIEPEVLGVSVKENGHSF